MTPSSQLREGQGADTFEFFTRPAKPGGKEDPMVKTLRLSAWETSDIHARLQALRDGQALAAEEEKPAEDEPHEVVGIAAGPSIH
eukprot:2507067-Pyramimonas_sp.AAC.1